MEENTGFMDSLAEQVTEFDVAKFLPELDSVLGWIELIARLAVMAGPVLILVLGLIYYFAPPAEANHRFGYRFYWGMGSVEAWQFTQRLAGAVWAVLGAVLSLIMLLIGVGYRGMNELEMVSSAVSCVLWELGLIGISCIAINVIVGLRYDKNGEVRPNTPIKVTENFLKLPTKKK